MGTEEDVFRVIVKMEQAGEEIKNVFYYFGDDGTPNAEDLADLIIDPLLQALDNIQSVDIDHTEVFVENLMDPEEDFHVEPATSAGQVTGDIMPKFVAWSYKLNVRTRVTKAGGKRIGGVPELWIVDGVADPTKASDLATAGGYLALQLEAPTGETYTPIVCRVTGTLSTGYTVTHINIIDSATCNGVSTQNTRKS